MIVYKIRDKTTGLYTNGGRYALSRFNNHGKVWFSLKEVLAFLRYFLNDQKKLLSIIVFIEKIKLKKNQSLMEKR